MIRLARPSAPPPFVTGRLKKMRAPPPSIEERRQKKYDQLAQRPPFQIFCFEPSVASGVKCVLPPTLLRRSIDATAPSAKATRETSQRRRPKSSTLTGAAPRRSQARRSAKGFGQQPEHRRSPEKGARSHHEVVQRQRECRATVRRRTSSRVPGFAPGLEDRVHADSREHGPATTFAAAPTAPATPGARNYAGDRHHELHREEFAMTRTGAGAGRRRDTQIAPPKFERLALCQETASGTKPGGHPASLGARDQFLRQLGRAAGDVIAWICRTLSAGRPAGSSISQSMSACRGCAGTRRRGHN